VAGRPPLRIGQHGKITRNYLGSGVWVARCKFRDVDGVTRRVERRGPADEHDKHGKLAEDALIEALKARRAPGDGDELALDTKIRPVATVRVPVSREGYRALRRSAHRWPHASIAHQCCCR
jgi:hypothetical protein